MDTRENHQPRPPPCCSICQVPVAPYKRGARPEDTLCSDPTCLRLASERSLLSPAEFEDHCQKTLETAKEERWQARSDKEKELEYFYAVAAFEAEEDEKMRQKARENFPHYSPEKHPRLSVPSCSRPLEPRSPERFKAYAEHLRSIAETFISGPGPKIRSLTLGERPPTTRQVKSEFEPQICGTCQGGCCVKGGDKAYITRQTFQKALARHPEQTPRELAQTYLNYLGLTSFKGSCINHGPKGCFLPPDLRADTCNSFECESLARFNSLSPDKRKDGALVISRLQPLWKSFHPDTKDPIVKVALVEKQQTSLLHLKPKKPPKAP